MYHLQKDILHGIKTLKIFFFFFLQKPTCLLNGDIIPPSVSTICKRGFEKKKKENHFLKNFFLVCEYFLF